MIQNVAVVDLVLFIIKEIVALGIVGVGILIAMGRRSLFVLIPVGLLVTARIGAQYRPTFPQEMLAVLGGLALYAVLIGVLALLLSGHPCPRCAPQITLMVRRAPESNSRSPLTLAGRSACTL